MRKSCLLFFTLATGAIMLVGGFNSGVNAGSLSLMFGSDLVDRSSSLIVKIKKKHNQGNQGERSCPAGYVVLEKPNKYGSFCEPKEGLPAPAPAEAEKCKFGMIGTAPNDCHCPEGTEFQGYKGCVKVHQGHICEVFEGSGDPKYFPFMQKCVSVYKSTGDCQTTTEGSKMFCCCKGPLVP
jgi:hypothetical protein